MIVAIFRLFASPKKEPWIKMNIQVFKVKAHEISGKQQNFIVKKCGISLY